MSKKLPETTIRKKERAFLVGVSIIGKKNILALDDSLLELSLLSETAGLIVVGQLTQNLAHPNPVTFIGSGKVQELIALAEETLAEVIIFDDELSPRHQRELEKSLGKDLRVLDRTALILDIFAQHAKTSEGMLQVELAQYEYYLPRLTGAWTHLARQAGGGGGRSGSVGGVGLRGPGETQLEVDRRSIRNKISHLKKELEKVRAHRQRYRSQRKRSRLPIVVIVGYTNSGKSTILNRISNSDVYVADQLFATLDPTTRRVELQGGYQALFTDTVGFIQKLPTTLVAAFRATLEEIAEADLLLHIIDISHPSSQGHARSVIETLKDINASQIPIITVLNKVDKLSAPDTAQKIIAEFPNSVAISAITGDGLPLMMDLIREILYENMIPIEVRLPYNQGYLISLFHETGQIERVENERNHVLIQGRIPGRLVAQFNAWLATDDLTNNDAPGGSDVE
ncbi:MAG: GTPase HflX [Chloroflexota bacterium]